MIYRLYFGMVKLHIATRSRYLHSVTELNNEVMTIEIIESKFPQNPLYQTSRSHLYYGLAFYKPFEFVNVYLHPEVGNETIKNHNAIANFSTAPTFVIIPSCTSMTPTDH